MSAVASAVARARSFGDCADGGLHGLQLPQLRRGAARETLEHLRIVGRQIGRRRCGDRDEPGRRDPAASDTLPRTFPRCRPSSCAPLSRMPHVAAGESPAVVTKRARERPGPHA